MALDRTTLIVIPARGGSVGIPHKAARPLAGKPTLVWTIETCMAVVGPHVLVTSDDPFILTIASERGLLTHQEPPRDGAQPLDGAIYAAVRSLPAGNGPWAQIATVQCTSPFLTAQTIRTCIASVAQGLADTALTVRDDRHLRWDGPIDSSHRHPDRVVRQRMLPCWRETGGCLVTTPGYVIPTCRFGPRVKLVEVQGAEALDLDTIEDWWVAERYAALAA